MKTHDITGRATTKGGTTMQLNEALTDDEKTDLRLFEPKTVAFIENLGFDKLNIKSTKALKEKYDAHNYKREALRKLKELPLKARNEPSTQKIITQLREEIIVEWKAIISPISDLLMNSISTQFLEYLMITDRINREKQEKQRQLDKLNEDETLKEKQIIDEQTTTYEQLSTEANTQAFTVKINDDDIEIVTEDEVEMKMPRNTLQQLIKIYNKHVKDTTPEESEGE